MLDVTFENGSCVNECNLKELRGTLENACKEENLNTTRFALVKNDAELYRFNANLYAYASDLIDFLREVDEELDESTLAVVLEVRENVPVWVWVVRNI
jgi:hypothetical protein